VKESKALAIGISLQTTVPFCLQGLTRVCFIISLSLTYLIDQSKGLFQPTTFFIKNCSWYLMTLDTKTAMCFSHSTTRILRSHSPRPEEHETIAILLCCCSRQREFLPSWSSAVLKSTNTEKLKELLNEYVTVSHWWERWMRMNKSVSLMLAVDIMANAHLGYPLISGHHSAKLLTDRHPHVLQLMLHKIQANSG
jgi:hypothetical protein